jgi:hypothetical protein
MENIKIFEKMRTELEKDEIYFGNLASESSCKDKFAVERLNWTRAKLQTLKECEDIVNKKVKELKDKILNLRRTLWTPSFMQIEQERGIYVDLGAIIGNIDKIFNQSPQNKTIISPNLIKHGDDDVTSMDKAEDTNSPQTKTLNSVQAHNLDSVEQKSSRDDFNAKEGNKTEDTIKIPTKVKNIIPYGYVEVLDLNKLICECGHNITWHFKKKKHCTFPSSEKCECKMFRPKGEKK